MKKVVYFFQNVSILELVMKTLSTQSRIANAVRKLPTLTPVARTLITVRHTTLPEPRKLMAHECMEIGPRSGFSVRIGGESGFRRIKVLGGTIKMHVGDRTMASASEIMKKLGA